MKRFIMMIGFIIMMRFMIIIFDRE